jgi:ornithine cyclodeaminase/alanine dehydrogenase-like protein (mu-crystallin family)
MMKALSFRTFSTISTSRVVSAQAYQSHQLSAAQFIKIEPIHLARRAFSASTFKMSKIFTVFGATGNQGGSVVNHILAHPELSKQYKIRAITRDPSSKKGQALEARGAEVVSADLNDSESIKKAINGSSAVFGVTNCKS